MLVGTVVDRSLSRETGPSLAVTRAPGVTYGCLNKVTAVPPAALLWVGLEVAAGRIPVLVDTGAQFFCLRTDVVKYLHMRGQPSNFSECTLPCMLADGSRTKISDSVTLHVRLLNFSWDHDFKILKEGLFPSIVGMDFCRRLKDSRATFCDV